MLRAIVVCSVCLVFVAFAAGACSDPSPTPAGATGDAAADTGSGPPQAGSPCEATREFVLECGGDLTCGPEGFDAWCEANDRAINSDAFRRAEAKCLTAANCASGPRRTCEYQSYMGETPTAAQEALVTAYCQTCDAADVAGCRQRETTFSPGDDPSEVSDLFIAAWELADDLVDVIRERCTGASLDAGADCARAFATCAAEHYLDRLPDCP